MARTYLEAAHAMQAGVAMKMNHDPEDTSPKHLRVGVNSAMVDTAAIVRLLVEKKIFSMEEFETTITDQMNKEAEMYEKELSERLGTKVTLH